MFGCTTPDPAVVTVSNGAGVSVQVCAIPFAEPAEVRTLTGDETIQTHEQALAALLQRASAKLNSGQPAVALVHAFVAGSVTCDSERLVAVGGADKVSASVFKGFDYVALGHLHSPQTLGGGHIRYAGSLLKYSASEADHNKGVTLVEFSPGVGLQARDVALRPRRDLRRITGTLGEIEAASKRDKHRDDYVYVTLTDPALPVNAEARLRACYPNMLEYRLASLEPSGEGAPAMIAPGLDDMQLFERFHAAFTDEPFTDEDRAIVAEIIAEINKDE